MRTFRFTLALLGAAFACVPGVAPAGLLSATQELGFVAGPVAMEGDLVLIGEPSAALDNRGAAWIFERGAGGLDVWSDTKFLAPSDTAAGDLFGNAVAIDGDTLIIGADFKDGTHVTEGAAYIFQRDVGGPRNWGEVAKLTGPAPGSSDHFGTGVAISGDTAVVTRPSHPTGQLGAAFVYERDAGGPDNWGLVKTLTASDASLGDRFSRVAMDGDVIVVGAWEHSPGGQAYVYERNAGGAGNWGETKAIANSDAVSDDDFGYAVALHGDTLVVGRPNFGPGPVVSGAAYVFERDEGGTSNWGEVKKIPAPGGIDEDFGASVAIDGDRLLVTSWNQLTTMWLHERDAGGTDNWAEVDELTTVFGTGGVVAIRGDVATISRNSRSEIHYTPMSYMFVTTGAYGSDFGGLVGGDAICRLEAHAAGLPGLWRSFLSVPGIDKFDRVPAGRPVATIAPDRMAEDESLLDGPISAPLDDEPGGSTAPADTHVWTGGSTGAESCVGFSQTAGTGGYGIATETDADWHAAGQDGCTATNRLYCVQFSCPGSPDPSCDSSWGSGTLLVKETKPGKEKLTVKMSKGPALTQLELGSPLDPDGTAYLTCLYGGDGTLAVELRLARAGELCSGKPCWLPLGASPPDGKGYQYQDRDRASDGVERIRLLTGATGKSKLLLRAANNENKGQTGLPTGVAAALSGETSATLQVHVGDLQACHAMTFDQVKKDTGDFFKAIR